jgi:3-deoxy-manno-octulosonate cytidylyltransferase (CMP-KDO synthetase)
MTKIVGVIPARYASSRFPGKPLIDLKGKSMIQRVYEGVSRSDMLSEVIVATDDQRIHDHVVEFGGKAVLTSPSHPSGTDRCGEIARDSDADIIINIQGDEPLVDPAQLDELLKAFNDRSVNIATLAIGDVTTDDLNNPNRIKLVVNDQSNAIYFSRSAVPNSQNADKVATDNYPFLRHIGLYAYRRETLLELVDLEPTKLEKVESLEQLRWMYYGYDIRVVETSIETPNIDVPEDVEKVLAHL